MRAEKVSTRRFDVFTEAAPEIERHVLVDIGAEKVKSIVSVPFEVPPRADLIRIRIGIEGTPVSGAVIDMGLADSQGLRGWSGGARREAVISHPHATPGYRAGSLRPGQWSVLLGAYRIPRAGVRVNVTIEVWLSRPRWLAADLHSHTVHSDGALLAEEAAREAAKEGLDVLAQTDHNTGTQNAKLTRNGGVILLPGMEFTTWHGHANVVGADVQGLDFRVADQSQLVERLQMARRMKSFVSINHPFDSSCEGCDWGWDAAWDVVNGIEVWNGPWRECNVKALHWWHQQLCRGRRLIAVGGSDFHRSDHPYIHLGWPTTWIMANRLTRPAVMTGLHQGRVCLSFSPHGPRVNVTTGTYGVGDTVPYGTQVKEVTAEFWQLNPGDTLRVIGNTGTLIETTATKNTHHDTVKLDKVTEWVRLEVWRPYPEAFQQGDSLMLAAMSNPLFLERQKQ